MDLDDKDTVTITNEDSKNIDIYGITDSMLGPLTNSIVNSAIFSSSGTLPTQSYTYTTNNTGPLTINPYSTTAPGLEVKGDSNFDGDITIKGKSILTMIEGIEKRLAILQPNPKKLEKYEALRKAYEHYKTLEALVGNDD